MKQSLQRPSSLPETLEQKLHAPNLLQSFKHAFSGIKETLIWQRNFKIQLGCAFLVLCLAGFCKIDLYSWLLLIQVISFVLTAELINTALEHVVDLTISSVYHPIAKAAKDAAAGAVLVASLFAVLSGLLIFAPHLMRLLSGLSQL